MKYTDTQIGFQEFPDEISLLINISNCPFHCPGCHSPELWEDIGNELNYDEVEKLINKNKGITCIGFMGGKPKEVNLLAEYIKRNITYLKTGWYWGGEIFPKEINPMNFDYIKLGPYIEKLGGLNNPNTNQRMYKYIPGFNDPRENDDWIDITYKFWKHGNNK